MRLAREVNTVHPEGASRRVAERGSPAWSAEGELRPIGEFAAAAHMSGKMLRHYDRIGLLRPTYVNPQSGYRYYDRSQLRRAELIRLMRQIGMGLRQIQVALADPESAPAAAHVADLENRVARGRRLLPAIEKLLSQVAATRGEPRVVELPQVRVVRARRAVGVYGVGAYVREASDGIRRSLPAAATAGPTFALLHNVAFDSVDVDVEVCVPVRSAVARRDTALIPETLAVTVDVGPTASDLTRLLDAHRAAGGRIERLGGRRSGPPRQEYSGDGVVVVCAPFAVPAGG